MLVEVVLVVVVVVLIYRTFTKPQGLPPGVWGLPLVGALPPRGVTFSDYFNSLKSKFGDVFSIRLGSRISVVVSDYNLIKTTFANPSLQGRPDFYSFKVFQYFDNLGIAFSSGQVWQDGRRFAMRHLRDFGMGKSRLEETIHTEVLALVDQLRKTTGKPTELSMNLNVAILNVIWSLVASRRYDITDQEIQHFSMLVQTNIDTIQGPLALLDLMPWLIPLVPDFIKTKWMKVNELIHNRDIITVHLKKVVEEHLATLEPDNPRDYIDAYLLEVEAQKDNSDSTFSSRSDYRNLLVSLGDLFVAGSETTSSTLRWVVLYMALYPKVQRRVQEELDAVVSRDTLPDLNHKDRLPYLEATLMEIQRRASLVPLGLLHYATEDTTLAGYTIPKGTVVTAFLESCHYNKKYFEKPHEFYPEHFLDDQGKVNTKKEGFLPFSIGRRQCLGESLAKMELYLFSAAILQKFTITSPPGITLTTDTDKTMPLFNFAQPYSVIFTKREAA